MTAEQRAGLSDAALAMTQPCIDELIKDISRRVQKAGAITDTAEYQIYRAQALGEGKKAIEQAVSKQIGISEEVIASLFEYVADKSLSPDENGSLKRMTEAYTRMTQSKTRELLRDLWADTPEGKVQPLQTAYARAMDFAFRQVATGTLDLNTAIRRAVTPLAKRGLRTIEQKSGRSVGIEYACRRYIMDQLGQLDDEIQRADHDALGCDGWEISAHAACAPDHEPIQGRQYGDAEFEKLNNSLQRRIGHLNCGHTANPIILGVNAPQYTEAQLQKFKDDNERGVVYNGYRYTLYEAGQEQSRIENGIRLIKRQILADEETESPDLQKHQIKLRVVQAEYARFCKAVGLPTRSERLQVAGFGRSQSNRAVWAYKKAAPEQLRDVEIAGHKLYSVTDERIRAVPKPFFQGVSNKVNGLAQEYARGVLKKVQRLEVGTEAVVNFTKDGKCTGYYVGGQNSMKVKPPEIQVPYYSLHNHPSNGIVAGRWAIFTFDGQQLNFNGGGGLSSGKLARATAKASQVLDGVPFYAGSKTLQKGTMRNNGSWPDADKLTLENGKLYMYKANGYTEGGLEAVASLLGDASASDIMQGTAASSSKGLHVAGSIVDRGNWSAQIVPGGKVTIPPGRHAGDGSVSAAALKTMALRVSDWPHEYPGMEWHYTLTGGTLVGVAGLGRASGDASSNVIESIRIAGNTIYVKNASGGYPMRDITLLYY